MRILLDTNILLSAALFPNGTIAKVYNKAVMYPNKINSLNKFISTAATSFEIIPTPTDNILDKLKFHDVKALSTLNVDRKIILVLHKSWKLVSH